MKILFSIGVLVAVAHGLAPDTALMERLDVCVRAVEAVDAAQRGRLPAAATQLSPALQYLQSGVVGWRSELKSVQARFSLGEVRAPERHFLHNGVIGCETFLRQYRAKVDGFFALLACVGGLILVLTVRVGLAMVPATQPRATHETSASLPPTDRTATGGR